MSRLDVTTRRTFLGALLLSAASGVVHPIGTAQALSRLPEGGTATLILPWELRQLDPHQIDDVIAALFGCAVADPVFAVDTSGTPYPSLALELPDRVGNSTRVRLRPGLLTANGVAIDARDLQATILRSARRGGMSLLAPITKTRVDPGDAMALLIDGLSPEDLARRMASPLTALVPRRFSPLVPDGTGPFRATLSQDRLRLDRNPNAARGPALLARIDVQRAAELSEALRAFETGDSDVGWLGSGLYRQRADSRQLNAGALGWVVLRTGTIARNWGAPGVAQQLADHLDSQRLMHLGVAAERPAPPSTPWGGAPGSILVDEGAPQLVKIAESICEQLGSPGHELSIERKSRAALARARNDNHFSLMVDFVRTPGALPPHFSLLAACGAELAMSPPGIVAISARHTTRTLRLGVIGELRIVGATAATLHGLGTWDLPNVWRARRQSGR